MGYSNSPVEPRGTREWPARGPPSRSMTGISQSTERSYSPTFDARAGGDRPTPGTYPMEALSRTSTGMSSGPGSMGRRGPGPSPTDSQGRRTPVAPYNPHFPPVPESGRQSPVPSPSIYSQTSTGAMPPPRSFTPGGSRSMTADAQNMVGGPTHLPRLRTSQNGNNGDYRAYTPNPYSSNTSSVTPSGPYRSFTQPNMPTGRPAYSGRQTPLSSESAYPPQRSGTAPLPQRQYSHDNMMDDIVSGYR